MVDVANVRRVADAIERHEIADLGFNMASYLYHNAMDSLEDKLGRNCGTTACIGGWTWAVEIGRIPTEEEEEKTHIKLLAARLLDLDEEQAKALFSGYGVMMDVGPIKAVRTLRHLADTFEATGRVEVRWDLPEAVS